MTKIHNPISDIACLIRVYDEPSRAALDQALTLAEVTGARLTVTIAAAKAAVPFSPMGSWFASSMLTDINQQTMTKAQEVSNEAVARARALAIDAHVNVLLDRVEDIAARGVKVARMADLIIVDQPVGRLDTTGILFEEALFRSGRPVMVACPRKPVLSAVKSIMIAWDGSAHAARAVADAFALFPQIESADIVSVAGEKDLTGTPAGADLARHLERKGAKTTLTSLDCGDGSVGAALDARAARTGADLIVMGGYGHSRVREFLFGGVTIDLTQSAVTPLFMAY